MKNKIELSLGGEAMIKKSAIVAHVGAVGFHNELIKNLQENKDLEAEIQYQMAALPSGAVQYSALIIYR
jgi:hypothetical protein